MSDVQYSDDGQWWWDGQTQEWKPVEGQDATQSPSDEAPAADLGGTEQWSANLDEWTEEQKDLFFTVTDQTVPPEGLDAELGDPQEINEGTEVA